MTRRETKRLSSQDDRRRRLEAVRDREGARLRGDENRDRAVLEERARSLARPASAPPPSDALAVVSVRIAKESYGIEAAHVLEVVSLVEFARLPGAALPVFAVMAWRGDLLLLLDIRRALGLSSTALNDLRHVVVLEAGPEPVGILVDEVIGMTTIRTADVRPLGTGGARELVRGVTSDALIVLETSALSRISDLRR